MDERVEVLVIEPGRPPRRVSGLVCAVSGAIRLLETVARGSVLYVTFGASPLTETVAAAEPEPRKSSMPRGPKQRSKHWIK